MHPTTGPARCYVTLLVHFGEFTQHHVAAILHRLNVFRDVTYMLPAPPVHQHLEAEMSLPRRRNGAEQLRLAVATTVALSS